MNLGQKRGKKIVYTPDSRIIHPVYLFQEMIADLLASRELAWRLLVRNIRGQYRQSFLGVFWAIVPPAMTAAGLTFANSTGILTVGETDIPYPAYVMLSTVLWQTFLESFNSPQVAIRASRPLLAQVKFPHEAIILTQLGQTLFNLVIKLLLVVVLFILFRVSVSWTIILAPIAIINLIMLGTAIGLLLVPITNLVQDISRSLEVITLAWFFLTPIAYPIPDNPLLNFIVELNPVTPLLVTAREMITTGMLSQTFSFIIVSLISFIGLIFGWLIYRLAMPYLIERIS